MRIAKFPTVCLATAALLAATQRADAEIKFKHHYISTAFPKLTGTGQLTVADFNKDGKPDLLMGQHFGTPEKRQYLFVNNGTLENWPLTVVTTNNTGDGGVNALDVDGDGWMDVISSGSWFRNSKNPASPYAKFVYASDSYGGHDMLVADIDKDGKKDVIVNTDKRTQNGGENGLFWFRIPSDPTQPWIKTRIGDAVHSGMWPGGIGDIDGDGDLDVFSGESEWNANRARWFVWENMDGKGMTFQRRTILDKLGAHNAIAADMDGDGDMDIVNKEFDPQPWNLLQGGQHADLVENQSTNPGARLALAIGQPQQNLRVLGMRHGELEVESFQTGPHSVELRDVTGILLESRAVSIPGRVAFASSVLSTGVYLISAKGGAITQSARVVVHP